MGDNRLAPVNESTSLSLTGQKNDASENLRASLSYSDYLAGAPKTEVDSVSNSDSMLDSIAKYKLGRVGIVTAEGIGLLPQGLWNGVKHNVDNPWEFAGKMGMAAAFGVGMRVLLPKAGAAKALAGTLMTYFMVKDAATPVLGAWKDAWDDQASRTTLHDSAKSMANGLGQFTVDMAAGLPVGMAADWAVGKALTGTRTGRAFEGWKDDFYNSESNPVGRFFKWSERKADSASDKLSEMLKRKEAQDAEILSIDEKLRRIQANLDDHGHGHGVLPKGVDPEAKAALDNYLARKRRYRTEMPDQIDTLLGDSKLAADGHVAPQAKLGEVKLTEATTVQPPGMQQRMVGHHHEFPPSAEGPTGGKAPEGGTAKPGDAAVKPPTPTEPVVKHEPGSQPDVVGKMATTVRDQAAKVSEQTMQIENFKEGVQSALTQSMREGPPPLDRGHFQNNKNLVELTSQIQTPEHIKQAGALLEHHRVANVQLGIPEQMPEIVDLNQYSRSIHKNMMDTLRQVGINPETVLRGTNSPIFLINDSGGAGPYTIPAIKGVTDTAVIVLPREYAKMLGVHVAGIYSHELGHDLIFGDLLKFPENLRDKVLHEDVVRKAMSEAVIDGKKGIADIEVEVPGKPGEAGLKMKKSELFTALLRAQANENTADMFGTSIDPNTGLSLATLLSSLRKAQEGAPKGSPGLLETRSMYGQEFAEDGNPMGFEVHGIDRWRLKLSAETLRQLSNGDAKVGAFADNLDKLASSMSRPGQNYVWANMDNPGKFVSIPLAEWDAIIPSIVKAQMTTKLPALHDNTWQSVLPNMAEVFPRVDALADQMAAAARSNKGTVPTFDKVNTKIENVYSAGLSAWMKALSENGQNGAPVIKPEVLLSRINNISESLTAQYRADNILPPETPKPYRGVNKNTQVVKPLGAVSNQLGRAISYQPQLRQKFVQWAPKTGIYAGVSLSRSMFEQERSLAQQLQDMEAGKQKGN